MEFVIGLLLVLLLLAVILGGLWLFFAGTKKAQ